jgi:hypothetical protein
MLNEVKQCPAETLEPEQLLRSIEIADRERNCDQKEYGPGALLHRSHDVGVT